MDTSVLRRIVVTALLFAVGLDVFLAAKLRENRREYRRAELRKYVAETGDYIPALPSQTLTGRAVEIGRPVAGKRQVIFLYRSTCPHWATALPAWHELADRLASDSAVEVLGLTSDSLSTAIDYANMHRLRFPSVPIENARWSALYKLGVVPQTIVVDSTGRIVHARVGGLKVGSLGIDSVIAAAAVSH